MAGKKISQLDTRVPVTTDLMIVGDPASGTSYKSTISSIASILSGGPTTIETMTESQRLAISSPATGRLVYQTDGTEGLYVKTSTAWRSLTMI